MADYYSLPFVCFKCRKAFQKKPQFSASTLLHEILCPQCGRALVFVGRYFKAPLRQNIKQWRKVQLLYESGWRADGYQARHLSTLRAAKTHLQEQPAEERAARIRRKQEEQQQKWSKMRKWPHSHPHVKQGHLRIALIR